MEDLMSICMSEYKWLWCFKNFRKLSTNNGHTGSNKTWLQYSTLGFNFTINKLLLSAGLGSDIQLS